MSRRRLVVLTAACGLLLLTAAGVFVAIVLTAPEKPGARITAETIATVRPGMTYAEVVDRFGCPPGHYDTPVRFATSPAPANAGRLEFWVGRQAAVMIQFDDTADGGKALAVNELSHPDAKYRRVFGHFLR